MKGFYLILLLLLSLSASSFAQQEGLYQFTASYFRSDPFKTEFSVFLNHLLKDPAIIHKTTRQRTDTSFFSFFGTYDHYNPFFFKPKRVEVQLEETDIKYSDSLPFNDTILVYQLRAYAEGNEKGIQEVKKEAEKIHRQYSRKFYEKNSQSLNDSSIIGGIHNYFVLYYGLAPLSVIWAKLEDRNEVFLGIIVRMKINANRAVLAAPLDNP